MSMEYLADNGTISTHETERTGDSARGMVDETLPMDYSIKTRKVNEVGIRMCLERTKESGFEKWVEKKNADIDKDKADENAETFADETHDVAHVHKKEEA